MADHHLPAPPFTGTLDELNPVAVEARYGLIDPGTLDRNLACAQVHSVLRWAGLQVVRQ